MTEARHLHKFGGSSLANPECYLRVVDILKQYSHTNDLIVVSAAGKTTNNLIQFTEELALDKEAAQTTLNTIKEFQSSLIQNLIDGESAQVLLAQLDDELNLLSEFSAPLSSFEYAGILAHGEVWSSRLLASLLNQHGLVAVAKDSRTFLRAPAGTQPEIEKAKSYPLIKEILAQHAHQRIVFTGFIAQNDEGKTVLLGRNGSDYSATIIGALSEVERVTIWSDVAGVYSADPRIVDDACLLPLLRLDEASELARLAAPVLHSRTLQPVAQSAIDLHLRCSYQPESGSTHIERVLASGRGAKIITSLNNVILLELTFEKGHDFNRLLTSVTEQLQKAQLTPLATDAHADQQRVRLAYTSEIANGAFEYLKALNIDSDIQLKEGYSLIAAVGAGVTNNAQHCFGFYQQLKSAPVEFITESQTGLSLVSVLRHSAPLCALVKGIHRQLFQAQRRVGLALCGKGNIGSSWLSLFGEQKAELEKRRGMNFELIAIIDSQSYWYDENGIDATTADIHFKDKAIANNGDEWLLKLGNTEKFDDVIVLDVTASQDLSNQYLDIAQQGLHLISANKIAGSSPGDYYYQVKESFEKINRHWLYNATVGAGLPINHTVKDLRESGDEVIALSGIFSGTLSWLFQQYDGSIPFSQLVELAWQQGLTEPDPRSDLDGSDVMRKLIILAREAGQEIEPDSVSVESLVPDALIPLSLDDFLDNCQQLDELLSERLHVAQRDGKVLRYVARLDKSGKARVGVEALPQEHALANLLPCDNIFAIESKWYKDNPLVIRGPGAGREVTAGAIQSDINLLSSLL